MDTREQIKNELPQMRKGLHELESKLAWLREQVQHAQSAVDMQRGMIMGMERLLGEESTEGL